jgi:beta-glucosidase
LPSDILDWLFILIPCREQKLNNIPDFRQVYLYFSAIMRSAFLSLILFLFLPGIISAQLYLDSTASVEERVNDLLSRMTIEEKIGQMIQTERSYYNVVSPIKNYFLGSILSGGGSVPGTNTLQDWITMYNRMQDAALSTRLRIPIIYGIDAVHGHSNVLNATIFPHNIGMGCTRNPQLVEACARATAAEVIATGLNWTFSPCIAVPRDIRWGRTYEGFGETPELQDMMAEAAVRGYQGDSLGTPGRILACAKHYIGDGGTTNGINQGNTLLTEAELRRIHLPGYIRAVEAGVGSVMVSFNSWNGEYCHGNRLLITDLLKNELGFKGLVVSDWEGTKYLSSDFRTAIMKSVNAGLDMFMEPSRPIDFFNHLKYLAEADSVSEERIDDAVRRILAVKFRMHLFEHPYATTAWADSLGCSSHRMLARQAVRESLVLLKNDGNLIPLSKTAGRILIAGRKANDIGSQCGGWTITWQGSAGAITKGTTILDAVRNARGTENVLYSPEGTTNLKADVAVVVVGEYPYAEGTGDRTTPQLSNADLTVIDNVKKPGIPYVVLLISGRPLVMTEVINGADAFVACWLPGTEASGITDVLFGDYDFTGRLSHTWPEDASQLALNLGDVPYEPLYAYGSGLSAQTEGMSSLVINEAFSIYPNPASDHISFQSAASGTIEIYSITGELQMAVLMHSTHTDLDISSLQDGVYILKMITSDGSARAAKFIKRK